MNLETLYPVSDIIQLARGGLYCLINDSKMKIDVRYGSNLTTSIGAILTKLDGGYDLPRDLLLDKPALKLKILEFNDDNQSRRLHHAYWVSYYKEKGYSLYRQHPASAYKIKVVIEDFIIYVKLVNGNYDETVVGVFEDMQEANEFISVSYKEGVISPVYAINDLSIAYWKRPIDRR